jgi:hypothetical protein
MQTFRIHPCLVNLWPCSSGEEAKKTAPQKTLPVLGDIRIGGTAECQETLPILGDLAREPGPVRKFPDLCSSPQT